MCMTENMLCFLKVSVPIVFPRQTHEEKFWTESDENLKLRSIYPTLPYESCVKVVQYLSVERLPKSIQVTNEIFSKQSIAFSHDMAWQMSDIDQPNIFISTASYRYIVNEVFRYLRVEKEKYFTSMSLKNNSVSETKAHIAEYTISSVLLVSRRWTVESDDNLVGFIYTYCVDMSKFRIDDNTAETDSTL